MRTYLRQLFRSKSQRLPRRPLASLRLEPLEDRFAPAVFDVNSLADVLTPAPGTVTLRSAIQQANATAGDNTINLTVAGNYAITLPGTPGETDNAAGEFAVTLDAASPANSTLLIQNTSGGTATIDGGGISRVFDVNPAAQNATPFTVTFQGLSITGGVASPGDGDVGSGGGIRAQGAANVVLTNVNLSGNTATADGGGISLESIGNVSVGTLTITGGTVSNNHAGDAGGGVESDGNGLVTINANTIQDNTCVNQGAGVWLDAGTANLNMTGDLVEGNAALTMLAGGIGNAGSGSVTLTDCTIENNSTGSSLQTVNGAPTQVGGTGAGFADAANLGSLTVTDCVFMDNTAAGDGGAIQEGGPNTIITGTTFDGNVSGGNGGGLFVNGGQVNVTNSVFRHNVAVNGGAAEVECNVFGATSCTFDTNHALGLNGGNGNTAGGGGNGGTVQIQPGGAAAPNVLFANSLFLGNSANNGAASNGGAIYAVAGSLEAANCQFTGNVTGGSGGAILDSNPGLLVFGSTFNNNRALAGSGGAIAVFATNTVEYSTLVGNSAGTNGGAIYDSGGPLTALADTINGNTCGNIGGGISIFNNGTLAITDTIVSGNSGTNGGADVFSLNITDNGGNLIGVNAAGLGFGAGTLTADPMLGPLQNNGGATAGAPSLQQVVQTEALLPGSPAIDHGKATSFALDEREFVRPDVAGTLPDVGAFEFEAAALSVTVSPATPTAFLGGSEVFTVTVTNTGANALPADNTTVSVALPAGLSLATGGATTFTLSALAAGRTQTFTVTVNANALGSQTVAATVVSPDATPNSTSNSATITVAPALTISGNATVTQRTPYVLALNGLNPAATGLAVNWGDGTVTNVSGTPSSVSHVYRAKGTFTISASATQAGVTFAAGDTVSVQVTAVTQLFAVGSGPGAPATVFVYNADGTPRFGLQPFGGFAGGVTVATGDVNGDGFDDVIVGAGGGPGGHVEVFDGRTGQLIQSFNTFDGFNGGVVVAAGDVNGDGHADVIVGAAANVLGGHVKVFDGATGVLLQSYFAFEGYLGPITVASSDVNGDGLADVIVGATVAGAGGHVKAFGGDGTLLSSFLTFPGAGADLSVAAGDVNGDGRAEILAASGGVVKVFDALSGQLEKTVTPFAGYQGVLRVAAEDVNGDGRADVIAGAGPGAPSAVRVFDEQSLADLDAAFFAFGQFNGGVYVGGDGQ